VILFYKGEINVIPKTRVSCFDWNSFYLNFSDSDVECKPW